MKIFSSLAGVLFVAVASAGQPASQQSLLLVRHPQFAPVQPWTNILSNWDKNTQTLRFADSKFGIGAERNFLQGDVVGFKYYVRPTLVVVTLFGRSSADPINKMRDAHGTVVGIHENMYMLGIRKSF